MHTRLNLLAARARDESVRRRRELFSVSQRRMLQSSPLNRTGITAVSGRRPLHHQNYTSDGPRLSASRVSFPRFHTTTKKISPSSAMAALRNENDDNTSLDDELMSEEIELLTSSALSQYLPQSSLPEEIFYRHGEESISNEDAVDGSLDLELGEGSMWDKSENAAEGMDYIVEEDLDRGPISSFAIPNAIPTPNEEKQLGQKTPMEMLRDYDSENRPSSDNLEELQLWLECAAQREAVMKYQKLIEKARDRKAFDSMSLMQRHVVQWYQDLRDAVEVRQKEYLSNEDTRTARKRYGPFLCSLHPEKMAVISSHEAITQMLLLSGKNGKEGVPLVKLAQLIGAAIETEVVSQRRMKERFATFKAQEEKMGDSEENVGEVSIEPAKMTAVDHWKFSASHLKMYTDELKRIDPKLGKSKRAINYAMRRAKQAMNTEQKWCREDLTHIGAALLSILVEHATIRQNGKEEPAFRVEKRWTKDKKSTSYVYLNDYLTKLFLEDDFLSWAANTTRHKPMIVPPSNWTGPNEGGYRWLQVDLMRTHGSNIQREALQHADLSLVADGLDILGKTPWKINKTILEAGEYCWNNNIPIGDIPSRTDLQLPPEPMRPQKVDATVYSDETAPETIAVKAANRVYRESMYKIQRLHQKNMDLRSLRCSATLKLTQANEFKDFENIYFPYNLDFRGRAYPVPPHLSNVGSDLCRGMLTFSESKPLGKRGLYWLKVHLANFAGKDKMSFDDRAKFIDDHMDDVIESVRNPFSEDPWWMTLDDPFQGLATCHEIMKAIDSGDPESYMCNLPVHMDGSCNGLQHYAALGRDTVGGKAVNLLESDGPEDVYVGVMHEVIRRVREEANRELDFDVSDPDSLSKGKKKQLKHNAAAKLVNGLIDRGVVKRTVMTSVYGVTYIGARTQIQEKIEEKLEEKGYDIDEIDREIFIAAGYLATVTMEVMGDLFQGAKKTKSWLADCARLITQQGHPVAWISPIGIPAIQPYRQKRPRTVVTVMQSVTVADENDDLPVHSSRQVTAFPPNYVHSLDSSHMLLTAMEMDRRGLRFSAVHDSFWTHACDVDEMNEALRDCFVELYTKPLLKDLKEAWELRYPEVDFPELPELGDLDLNEVKDATYFFQ